MAANKLLLILALLFPVLGNAQVASSQLLPFSNPYISSSSSSSGGTSGTVDLTATYVGYGSPAGKLTGDSGLTWASQVLNVTGTVTATNVYTLNTSSTFIRTAGISATAISLTSVQAARILITATSGITTNGGFGFTQGGTTTNQVWINQTAAGGTSALDVSGTISGTFLTAQGTTSTSIGLSTTTLKLTRMTTTGGAPTACAAANSGQMILNSISVPNFCNGGSSTWVNATGGTASW